MVDKISSWYFSSSFTTSWFKQYWPSSRRWSQSSTLHLEAALRKFRNNAHALAIAYADDVDFINKNGVNLNIVEKILEKWNLKMNPTKTETFKIGSNNEWKNAKKLGMLFDTKQEWKRRKQLIGVRQGPMEAGEKPYTGEQRFLKIFEHTILSLFFSRRKP